MLSLGSISREDATTRFPFLAPNYRARRSAIRSFTHRDPDFVFWIYPDGKLCNAHTSHLQNPPKGFEHILNDEPNYGGFFRGRVASLLEDQLIVVYCEQDALASAGKKLQQFLLGVQQLPLLIHDDTLIISDNGDIYGTLDDLFERQTNAAIA
ncbi:hypothetical protein EON83_09350 [bacterium]|nr:MAG: hypothetical protein EON83_09350 [bacterium]